MTDPAVDSESLPPAEYLIPDPGARFLPHDQAAYQRRHAKESQ